MSTANKIQLVSNRVELAKQLLLSQFSNKPNINNLLDVLISRVQELENNINDLQSVRTLSGSYGVWLDQIGEEAGVSRGNYNDNDYKTAIKIAYARQSSSASVDDILEIVKLLTNDDEVTLLNPYPYYLELIGYLWCVSDSQEGLDSLARLFPVNTGVRIIKRDSNPFTLDTEGKGIGLGMLSELVYYNYGDSTNPRFTTTETAILPPLVDVPVKNITLPTISGSGLQGSVLTLNEGVWEGDPVIVIVKQWLRDGADISGETGNTYTVTSTDLGKNISVRVTASNPFGLQIVNTNSIYVDSVAPSVSEIVDGLGISSISRLVISTGGVAATASVSVTFGSDGEVTLLQSPDITARWLTTTDGMNYTVSYTIISGIPLVGLNAGQEHSLATSILLSKSITSNLNSLDTGTYQFTIRNVNDPTDVKTKTINMTVATETDN